VTKASAVSAVTTKIIVRINASSVRARKKSSRAETLLPKTQSYQH
jgi:hypothetical protein